MRVARAVGMRGVFGGSLLVVAANIYCQQFAKQQQLQQQQRRARETATTM